MVIKFISHISKPWDDPPSTHIRPLLYSCCEAHVADEVSHESLRLSDTVVRCLDALNVRVKTLIWQDYWQVRKWWPGELSRNTRRSSFFLVREGSSQDEQQQKALLRVYYPLVSLNKALLNPYFFGGGTLEGRFG